MWSLTVKIKNKTPKPRKELSRLETLGLGKEKDAFTENLSMLFSSGVDVSYALESLKNESKTKGMKNIISFLQDEISSGSPIWRALEKAHFFPQHIISLIRIGEESGRLPQNLQVIAAQQQKDRVFKSKIRSAMMYPVFVLVLAVVIGLGIAWFILPKLATVFSQLRMELPFITKMLIGAGLFMGKNGGYFVPAVLLVMGIIFYFLFLFPKTKFIGQGILLSIPGVGRLLREIELGRLGYLLGTLLEAGVPVVNSLESLEKAASVRGYKKLYGFLIERISEGNSFEKSFSMYKKSQKLIPYHIQSMIFAAEKSGNFPQTLIHIGKIFEEKTEDTTKNMTVILEPVLLVVVWLGVVFIALAVIMPIYNLIGGLNANKSSSSPPPPVEEAQPLSGESDSSGEEVVGEDLEEKVTENEQEETVSKIIILETGTGFLNVRESPSKEGTIISKVKPAEEYEIKGKEQGWYQIAISESELGWISAEYAKEISLQP